MSLAVPQLSIDARVARANEVLESLRGEEAVVEFVQSLSLVIPLTAELMEAAVQEFQQATNCLLVWELALKGAIVPELVNGGIVWRPAGE